MCVCVCVWLGVNRGWKVRREKEGIAEVGCEEGRRDSKSEGEGDAKKDQAKSSIKGKVE